eukprot:2513462-Pleurochrysis_carterae.AAC.1
MRTQSTRLASYAANERVDEDGSSNVVVEFVNDCKHVHECVCEQYGDEAVADLSTHVHAHQHT